jgi:hypothetical protein
MGITKWRGKRRRQQRAEEAAKTVESLEGGTKEPVNLPGAIGWLLDAPLFIDEKQVEAFYDAVLRPDFEGTAVTLSNSISPQSTIGGELTVGAAIPWLGKTEGTAQLERQRTKEAGRQAGFRRVVNPYRHLLALAIHYASRQPDRLVLASPPDKIRDGADADVRSSWTDAAFISRGSRALVMLELPPGAIFIPAALELVDGKVVTLFDQLAPKLQKPSGKEPPTYPGSAAPEQARNAYWEWFAEEFDDRHALEVVEEAAKGGRIAWIAFRVPLNGTKGPFLHLLIAGRGQYETGVFAYNLINRGSKHGMRLVGTLKTEPDLNVLAIFER